MSNKRESQVFPLTQTHTHTYTQKYYFILYIYRCIMLILFLYWQENCNFTSIIISRYDLFLQMLQETDSFEVYDKMFYCLTWGTLSVFHWSPNLRSLTATPCKFFHWQLQTTTSYDFQHIWRVAPPCTQRCQKQTSPLSDAQMSHTGEQTNKHSVL